MHVLIVTFKLQGLTEQEYAQISEQKYAPAFQNMPGLLSKVWLTDSANNTYGGVYMWRDRESMEAYQRSELFGTIAKIPYFTEVSVSDFGVLEAPTRMSGAMAAALA